MNKELSTKELEKLSRWLKVLCEPNRLFLLEQIIQGVQCNCEIGENLQMAPNLVSHHLKVLQEAGLVEAERNTSDSRWIFYSINEETLNHLNLIISDFLDSNRIRPREITCGPKIKSELNE